MTVRELFQRMDSQELSEWMAYFQIMNEKPKTKADPKVAEAQAQIALGPMRSK